MPVAALAAGERDLLLLGTWPEGSARYVVRFHRRPPGTVAIEGPVGISRARDSDSTSIGPDPAALVR